MFTEEGSSASLPGCPLRSSPGAQSGVCAGPGSWLTRSLFLYVLMLGGGVVFSGGPPFGTSPGGSECPCEVYQGGWNGHWPPIGAFFGTLGHNFGPFGWPSTHSRGGGGWNVPVIFSGGVGMAIGPPLAPFLVPWAPFWASWMAIGTFPGGRNSPMKFSGGGVRMAIDPLWAPYWILFGAFWCLWGAITTLQLLGGAFMGLLFCEFVDPFLHDSLL